MSVTEDIKSRLDIIDIVSETVSLRKSGRSYAGFCPFHANSRTPAFYVFPETQTWHFFGACAEGGDLFSYMMKREGWDFKETLRHLAGRAGVQLEEYKADNKAQQTAEKKQLDLLTAAADYFHMLLLYAPEAEHARHYVESRGLQPETLETFRIGFSLDAWSACRTHFNDKGYTDDELVEVGLLTEHPEKQTRYDRFRNRLMIPIQDGDGRIVGFGARTLDKDGIPKYLNSPQTPLFDKGHILFGFDKAKRSIREARQVVIVEGYMDVIAAWQAGFANVVAQMGTALTEQQLQLLKRYTKRFVLALDADAAGASATMRSLQVARQTLDRETEVRFDAHGLVKHEGRLQADIRVVTMPEGDDPDSILRRDVAEWPRLLAQAKPVVAYVIDVATRDLDMSDAKGKTAVARQVIPLIKDILDPVERDHYWQELARALRVDERSLRQIQLPPARPQPKAVPSIQAPVPKGMTKRAERGGNGRVANTRQANYLRECFNYPQIILQINQKLMQCQQATVVESDFSLPEDRELLRHLYQQMTGRNIVTTAELCDSLEDEILQDRVHSLLQLPPTPESELSRLPEKLALSVLRWRQDKINDRVKELQLLHQEINSDDGIELAKMYAQQINEASLIIYQINKAVANLLAT
jgi:DNA primase